MPYRWLISKAVQKDDAVEGLNRQREVIAPVPLCTVAMEYNLHVHCASLKLLPQRCRCVHLGETVTGIYSLCN
jgi:hypothetical protein